MLFLEMRTSVDVDTCLNWSYTVQYVELVFFFWTFLKQAHKVVKWMSSRKWMQMSPGCSKYCTFSLHRPKVNIPLILFCLYSIYNRLFQMGTVDDMIFVCTTWLYFLVKCIMKEIGLPSFDYNYLNDYNCTKVKLNCLSSLLQYHPIPL